jgi:hypothetical protein
MTFLWWKIINVIRAIAKKSIPIVPKSNVGGIPIDCNKIIYKSLLDVNLNFCPCALLFFINIAMDRRIVLTITNI